MDTKFMAGLYMLWMLLMMVSAGMDGLLFYDSGEGVINKLISAQVVDVRGAGIAQLPVLLAGYGKSILGMLAWEYPMYNNVPGTILKFLILYPISITALVNLILFMAQVASSTAAAVSVAAGLAGSYLFGLAKLVGG